MSSCMKFCISGSTLSYRDHGGSIYQRMLQQLSNGHQMVSRFADIEGWKHTKSFLGQADEVVEERIAGDQEVEMGAGTCCGSLRVREPFVSS
ncbi:hypothetical protein Tco_1484387 [Tanacetum coccineum]